MNSRFCPDAPWLWLKISTQHQSRYLKINLIYYNKIANISILRRLSISYWNKKSDYTAYYVDFPSEFSIMYDANSWSYIKKKCVNSYPRVSNSKQNRNVKTYGLLYKKKPSKIPLSKSAFNLLSVFATINQVRCDSSKL